MLLSQLAGEKSNSKEEPAFKNNTAPLQRKQTNSTKSTKQKAVVQPLQGQPEMTDESIDVTLNNLFSLLPYQEGSVE